MKGDKTQKFDFVTDTTSQKKKVKETHRAIEKCPSLATNSCFKKEKKKKSELFEKPSRETDTYAHVASGLGALVGGPPRSIPS